MGLGAGPGWTAWERAEGSRPLLSFLGESGVGWCQGTLSLILHPLFQRGSEDVLIWGLGGGAAMVPFVGKVGMPFPQLAATPACVYQRGRDQLGRAEIGPGAARGAQHCLGGWGVVSQCGWRLSTPYGCPCPELPQAHQAPAGPVTSVSLLVLGGTNTARTPLPSFPRCPSARGVSQGLRGWGGHEFPKALL